MNDYRAFEKYQRQIEQAIEREYQNLADYIANLPGSPRGDCERCSGTGDVIVCIDRVQEYEDCPCCDGTGHTRGTDAHAAAMLQRMIDREGSTHDINEKGF